MFVEVAKVSDIAKGGMKAVKVNGKWITLCNDNGKIYAINRRCGHMSAPLEMGTLNGYILTCPMHHSQFDITNGEALSGPVPTDFEGEVPPENMGRYLQNIGMLAAHIETCDIETYPVKVDGDSIKVNVTRPG